KSFCGGLKHIAHDALSTAMNRTLARSIFTRGVVESLFPADDDLTVACRQLPSGEEAVFDRAGLHVRSASSSAAAGSLRCRLGRAGSAAATTAAVVAATASSA